MEDQAPSQPEKKSVQRLPYDPEYPAGGARVASRRSLLVGGGTLSLAGFLAACGVSSSGGASSSSSSAASSSAASGANRAASTAASTPLATADKQLIDSLIAKAPSCPMSADVTEGPYWFDVNYIRSDIRENKEGLPLELGIKVVDLDGCTTAGNGNPVRNAVVEIWHCDALGIYSGFEATSSKPNGGLGTAPPPMDESKMAERKAKLEKSDGAYSQGDPESEHTDDSIFLRGAQPTDSDGFVHFTSIYPGWYFSRTVHIHTRVHIDKKLVLTSQLYFDDTLNNKIFSEVAPYNQHTNRDTFNDADGIYVSTGQVSAVEQNGKVFAGITLGIRNV